MAFHRIEIEPGTSTVGVSADELLEKFEKHLKGDRKMPCPICNEPIDIPNDFEAQIKAVANKAGSHTVIFGIERDCPIPDNFKLRFYKADDSVGGEEVRTRRKAMSNYLFQSAEEGKRKYQK